jgi:hypothetical protein
MFPSVSRRAAYHTTSDFHPVVLTQGLQFEGKDNRKLRSSAPIPSGMPRHYVMASMATSTTADDCLHMKMIEQIQRQDLCLCFVAEIEGGLTHLRVEPSV